MWPQFKRLTWKASWLMTAISLLVFSIALAAPGDLDTTFDSDGLVTFDSGGYDWLADIAVQTDGKIVAAGRFTEDFALIRYNPDGSLDTTFSGDGWLTTNFGQWAEIGDVTIQANGKIVVAGNSLVNDYDYDVALARYHPDGTLDTTFSGDGKQTTDFGGADNWSSGLAIQPNGKIVVAGSMWNGTNSDFAVYRYLSNGSLDTTFSGDGMVNINFGRSEGAYDLAIQSDGKILVAGNVYCYRPCTYVGIARLNANGSLDTTFSGNGKQTTKAGIDSTIEISSLALQPDGKIVLAGQKFMYTDLSSYAILLRYNPDGSLDTTFNGTGRKAFRFAPASNFSQALDVIVQSDGKIVVVGDGEGAGDFALARLNNDGSFDTTFSGNGKVSIVCPVPFGEDALALQSDGKYVIGGYTMDNTGLQYDFALARVLP